MQITKPQIKKIHVYASMLGLSYDEYKDVIRYRYGVESSKQLSKEKAIRVIKDLKEDLEKRGIDPRGTHENKRHEDKAGRPGMAFPAQLRKIEAIWNDVSRADTWEGKQKALRAFLNNRFGIADLRFIPLEKVPKIIHALEIMKKQKDERDQVQQS